ncbi:MAG TPA: hypothetical protein QF901_13025, partial [Gammaproteobacteria bacterium]|nr:hypothetical protein [Gammaproteobacteria bacterium]
MPRAFHLQTSGFLCNPDSPKCVGAAGLGAADAVPLEHVSIEYASLAGTACRDYCDSRLDGFDEGR